MVALETKDVVREIRNAVTRNVEADVAGRVHAAALHVLAEANLFRPKRNAVELDLFSKKLSD